MLLRAFGGSAINGVEPLGKSIVKLFTNGSGYWFRYALFLIFVLYSFAERILDTPKKMLAAMVLVAIYDWIPIPSWFQLSSILYELPYFILGDVIRKTKLIDYTRNVSKVALLVAAIGGYLGPDYLFSSKSITLTVIRDIRAVCVIGGLVVLLNSNVVNKFNQRVPYLKKRIVRMQPIFSATVFI